MSLGWGWSGYAWVRPSSLDRRDKVSKNSLNPRYPEHPPTHKSNALFHHGRASSSLCPPSINPTFPCLTSPRPINGRKISAENSDHNIFNLFPPLGTAIHNPTPLQHVAIHLSATNIVTRRSPPAHPPMLLVSRTGLITPPPEGCSRKTTTSTMPLRLRVSARRHSSGTESDNERRRSDSLSHNHSHPTVPSIPPSQIRILPPPTPSEPPVVAPVPTHPQLLQPPKWEEAPEQPRIPPPEPRDASPSAYTLWKLARLASTDSRSLDHPPTPIRPSSSPDPPDAQHHQYIPPGAYRPLTFRNVGLAITILQQSTFALFTMLWTNIHPVRIVLFLLLNFIRGLFPAVRSFSQSLLLDQVGVTRNQIDKCVDLCSYLCPP